MTKTQAKQSIKKLNVELFSLNPSSLITLFEIDATDLAYSSGAISDTESLIFRFHNNIKLTSSSIIWQGYEYVAAPIMADGFEISAKGVIPTPKVSISSSEDGISFLSVLKEQIRNLDDLIGAKITRIRTFAKYLDSDNFLDNNAPEGFSPDPNVEYPRDIYYFDRKSNENKYNITYELSSIIDVEGISIPKRTVLSDKCTWNYRGCGCLYEYKQNRVESIHGKSADSTLPDEAIPIANANNELITDILQIPSITVKGLWKKNTTYLKGEAVFIEKNGIKYYFVCKVTSTTVRPPNTNYWVEDACSQTIAGCKLRWKNKYIGFTDTQGLIKGVLPFGGFPGTNKAQG